MAAIDLTLENFEPVVASGGLVLVEFWAPGCAPCRVFGPVYQRVSDQHPDVVFGRVDTDAEPELAVGLGIYSVPSLLVIRDGVVLYAQPGALRERVLEQLIVRASEVDMEQVCLFLASESA